MRQQNRVGHSYLRAHQFDTVRLSAAGLPSIGTAAGKRRPRCRYRQVFMRSLGNTAVHTWFTLAHAHWVRAAVSHGMTSGLLMGVPLRSPLQTMKALKRTESPPNSVGPDFETESCQLRFTPTSSPCCWTQAWGAQKGDRGLSKL